MVTIAVLNHVKNWDHPSDGEKRLMQTSHEVARNFLRERLEEATDETPASFIFPNLDLAMEIARATHNYLITKTVLKADVVEEDDKLDDTMLLDYLKSMAYTILAYLSIEGNTEQGKETLPATWLVFSKLSGCDPGPDDTPWADPPPAA